MRRRFGRGRRTGNANEAKRAPIDAQAWLQRVASSDLTDAEAFEPLSLDGVPESYAALGSGEDKEGVVVLVAASPRSGCDATCYRWCSAAGTGRERGARSCSPYRRAGPAPRASS